MPPTKTVPEQVLDALASGPMTKPQLAKALGQRYDTINGTIRRLVIRGEVERVVSPHNPARFMPYWYARIYPQEAS